MENPEFQKVCDQFSDAVDGVQFERFRWDRDEAPKLARLVELVKGAFEERRDFDLAEEGATSDFKQYVVKVHSMRTAAIAVKLENGQAVLTSDTVERSPYTLASREPIATDYENVDEQWIADALKTLISRIRAPSYGGEPEPIAQANHQSQ